MSRSRLEIYIDIVKSVLENGQLNHDEMKSITGLTSDTLKTSLAFLVQQGLVQEKKTQNLPVTYTVTLRGAKIVEFFKIKTLVNA